jgi:hypothetical protein
MKGFHNLFANVKVAKNVGGPICLIIAKKKFIDFIINVVKYIALLNHNILNMI